LEKSSPMLGVELALKKKKKSGCEAVLVRGLFFVSGVWGFVLFRVFSVVFKRN